MRAVSRLFSTLSKKRKAGLELAAQPDGKVIVRVRDPQGGFGRYIFRVSWALEGGGPPPEVRRDGDDRHPPERRSDGDAVRDTRIVSAFWGVPGRGRQVTGLLQERMHDGRLRIQASNEEMGFDPAVGTVKALVVVYEIRGRRKEVKVAEGDFLELP